MATQTSSKNPKQIEKILRNSVSVEDLHPGKIIYGLSQKKKDSGFGSNSRLLFINQGRKTIGYCEQFPKELPLKSADSLKVKNDASIITCKAKIPSGSPNQIEMTCDANPKAKEKSSGIKQKQWVYTFQTKELAKEWLDHIRKTQENIKKAEEDQQRLNKTTVPDTKPKPNYNINATSIPPNLNQSSQSINGLKSYNGALPIDSFIRQPIQQRKENDSLPPKMIKPQENLNPSNNIPLTDSEYIPGPPTLNNTARSLTQPGAKPETNLSHSNISGKGIQGPSQLPPPVPVKEPEQPQINNSQGSANYTKFPQPNIAQPSPQTQGPGGSKNPSNIQPNIVQPTSQTQGAGGSNIHSNIPGSNGPAGGSINNGSKGQGNQGSLGPGGSNTNLPNNPPVIPTPRSVQAEPNPQPSDSRNDWNSRFNSSQNPTQILIDFQKHAEGSAKMIIDDLVLEKSMRKVQTAEERGGLWTYDLPDLEISLAFINETENYTRLIKNQFRNYDYILNSMKRRGVLRVPLSCIVEYKGITCFVKAKIQNFELIKPEQIQSQLEQLQQVTKVTKEIFFKSINIQLKRSSTDNHNTQQVIYIDKLYNFLPTDVYADKQESQLRSQTVQTLDRPITSMPYLKGQKKDTFRSYSGSQTASQTMRAFSEQVLSLLERMEIVVINTDELVTSMHLNGVNLRCLSDMYKRAQLPLVKKYLLAEMVSRACSKIIREKLQAAIQDSSLDRSSRQNPASSDIGLLQQVFELLNDIVSANQQSDKLWKNIASQVKRNFQVSNFSKQDIAVGYFLSSLFQKANLNYNFDNFIKKENYLRAPNLLKRNFVVGFAMKTKMYSVLFVPEIQRLEAILNEKPSQQGLNSIIEQNKLETESIPEFYKQYGYDARIRIYLSNFIDSKGVLRRGPGDNNTQRDLKHLNLYSIMINEPPTLRTIKLAIKCAKWQLTFNRDQQAQELLDLTAESVSFWGNQHHPLLSELYDIFTAVYYSSGELDKAENYAKSSIANAVKVAGGNSTLAADKYYAYGNICLQANKKNQALNSYTKVRDINQANDLANGSQHASLCLKMAILYLNMGKYSESLARTLECLKIVECLENNETLLVNTYQTLARIYEITEQKTEMQNLAQIAAKTLKDARLPQNISRNLKIIIAPNIKGLSANTSKQLVDLISALKARRGPRQAEWKGKAQRVYQQKNSHDNFALSFCQKLQKADRYLTEINSKNLLNGYTGPQTKATSEAEEFLVDLDIMCCLVADRFMLGLLTENI